jgi:hypothetical protein
MIFFDIYFPQRCTSIIVSHILDHLLVLPYVDSAALLPFPQMPLRGLPLATSPGLHSLVIDSALFGLNRILSTLLLFPG